MDPSLRTTLHVETRSPEPGAVPSPIENQNSKIKNPAVLEFISSDETLDRYSEIITVAGWRLDSYLRNPVFQNAHNYGDVLFTLGRALVTELRSIAGRQVLYQQIQFAVDANPVARIAYGLYQGKFLNAVSVGFLPIRWEDPPASEHPGRDLSAGSAPQLRRKYVEQELLEVSAVSIPANPNALALAFKSGAVPKSDLRDTADLLQQILQAPSPEVSPHDAPTITPELVTLVHELHTLLKS
jgi:phage head maturation protease